ncbi:D-sedoheptulose-7-phosphate isomerase [Chondromyces crocatus]|uniref:Phosphoheptose isomerase n=1 Tax=Chondromyces crocatus TaxID=52 RepID=A0A0K1EJH5_CHOCO|nr:SIS domain-containing protein [Chondromyces crocatus]AKT40827.1 phosphoheptose isomerase [Chondromyces crocatus]
MSTTEAFVDQYLRETAEIALATRRDDLAAVIEVLFSAYQQDRTIYTCGNGGSAANASHLACDISKFTWVEGKRRFKCTSLCDNAALISALTNDVGFNRIFLEQLEGRIVAGDVLVCLSVHGGSGADKAGPWSQNLVSAADCAKRAEAKVVALVGYDGGALRQMADASVIVPPTRGGTTSTPHVEGFHEVYHHLICERLRQLVAEA